MTTYHHHDALGSVIALTNGNGAVVERYKYDVFGQPTFLAPDGVTVRAESDYGNKFLFTGREWLPLSGGYHQVINYGSSAPPTWQPLPGGNQVGLYDYRNRAYTALLGRFMQTDPIRFDAGDANLYRYVGNRATGARDAYGLWPTGLFGTENVHGNSINRVLPFLTAQTRNVLIKQQIAADQDQSGAGSYKHGMSDGTSGQSPVEARKLANDYVRSQLIAAQKASKERLTLEGLQALGNAIHAMQDATSPMHQGFQPWDGGKNKLKSINHGIGENWDPGTMIGRNCALDRATKAAWDYFTGQRPMPADFFGNGYDSKPSVGTEDVLKQPIIR